MTDEKETYNMVNEFEFDSDIVQKINDYIFLDSKRYDGYAGDNI